MTTERERILQKIKRVQALAVRGVGGEKESAAALLETLMKRYDIEESDILAERKRQEWFRYKTEIEERLLLQVIYSITGECAGGCVGSHSGRKHKKVGIECTAAERLEIELSFEFYNAAMQAEMNRFFAAFINKNKIFPPPDKTMENGRTLDAEELAKLQAMMNGMDKHTRRAMLESGVTA